MSLETARRQVRIDFLYLDLDVCTRCRGTDASLESALQTVRGVLDGAGVEVRLNKTLVDSEQKALSLSFISSPTIRVDGQDIALEFRESRCESEACACGTGAARDTIQCRVWVYQGKEYTEAPEPMVVDAILSAVYGARSSEAIVEPERQLPDNLKRFFGGEKEASTPSCCDAREQESCCDASQKESCCGSSAEVGQAGCGCR